MSLKNELVALIDQFVAENREGYRDRPEVIAAAVRRFLDSERLKLRPEMGLEQLLEAAKASGRASKLLALLQAENVRSDEAGERRRLDEERKAAQRLRRR